MRHVRYFMLAILALLLIAIGVQTPTQQASAATGPAAGVFVPVAPSRLLNATDWTGGTGNMTAGQTKSVQVLGVAGVPSSGVSAVVVDLAAHSTTATTSSYLTTWASGETRPGVASMYYTQENAPRSNTAIVKVGSDGKVSVYNYTGTTSVTVDIQGYFTATSGETSVGGFKVLTPSRIANTDGWEYGEGVVDQKLAVGQALDIQAEGLAGIPNSATSLFVNVEIRHSTAPAGTTWIGAGGSTSTWPVSMEYGDSGPYSSGRTVPLDSQGRIRIKNLTGSSINVKVDVQGYFTDSAGTGGSFTAVTPANVYSTTAAGQTDLAGKETRVVEISGRAGIPNGSDVSAVAVTVSVKNWTATGTVSVFPADMDWPGNSTVAFVQGEGVPSNGSSATTLVGLSDGRIAIQNNSTQPVTLTLTAQGWFSNYDHEPDAPLRVDLSPASGGFASLTPTLRTYVSDPDGTDTSAEFAIYRSGIQVWTGSSPSGASGSAAQVAIPSGVLTAGLAYTVRSRGTDGSTYSPWSPSQTFTAAPLPSVPHGLTATPCIGDCTTSALFVSSLTPTFAVTSEAPDGAPITYQWELFSPTGELILAATTSSAGGVAGSSWTLPTGTLVDGGLYAVRTQAQTGYSSGWSQPTEFMVEIAAPPSGAVDPDGPTTDPEIDPDQIAEVPQDVADYQILPELTAGEVTIVAETDPGSPATSPSGASRVFGRVTASGDTGPNIPYSGWAGCGAFSSKFKVVHDYGRTPWHARMERSYARLYCGIYEPEPGFSLFGYRHIKDKHAGEFSQWSWRIGRQWQDLTAWMMKWTLDTPDKATVQSPDRFCYQRRFFLMQGSNTPYRVRVVIWLGRTGVRIMSMAPTSPSGAGPCRGPESAYSAAMPDAR